MKRVRGTPPHRRRAGPAASSPGPGATPLRFDPWPWLVVAAIVPALLHVRGVALGEPFADDFDYLRRTLLERPVSLFDGGGAEYYWRPLGRQIYYLALGPLMLAHPGVVAAVHAAALALAGLVLYRALRPGWSAPAAAAAATFPFLLESTRMLVAWPSHFQDVGAILFTALALHERARGRMATSLAAVLCALLCKEVAVIAAALLPWLPGPAREPPAARWRWAVALGALAAAWGAAYGIIARRMDLTLPGVTAAEAPTAAAWLARYAWGLGRALADAFNLSQAGAPWDAACAAAVLAIGSAAAVTLARRRGAEGAGQPVVAWALWGGAWLALLPAMLTGLYPDWTPHRTVYGAIGLGMAVTAALARAHPALLAALVVVRLAGFIASPGAEIAVGRVPGERGAVLDLPKLARIQRLVHETRTLLAIHYPALPAGARVGLYHLPAMTEYALAGDRSLQVWYRDSTLRWVRFGEIREAAGRDPVVVVEGQRDAPAPVALVDVAALRHSMRGADLIDAGDWERALDELRRAERAQSFPEARVFLGTVVGRQAVAHWGLGDVGSAEREARRARTIWENNDWSSFVLGLVLAHRGRLAEAEALLAERLRRVPADSTAARLRAEVQATRARARAPAGGPP